MTILVTGATGTLGGHVVDQLLGSSRRVRALTRDATSANLPAEVEVVTGDLTDPATLTAAFDGVTAIHLLNATGDDHTPLATGSEIVSLAVAAGVERVTVVCAGQEGPVEQALATSGLEWTQVRPVDFMANTLGWAEAIRREAVVREPFGERRTASADEADVAAVIATVLAEGGYGAEILRVTGPEALAPADKVHALSEVTGRSIAFVELTPDEARQHWRKDGWPEEAIDFMLHMWATVPPEVAMVTTTVERVTGAPGRTFAQWAADHADAFRA